MAKKVVLSQQAKEEIARRRRADPRPANRKQRSPAQAHWSGTQGGSSTPRTRAKGASSKTAEERIADIRLADDEAPDEPLRFPGTEKPVTVDTALKPADRPPDTPPLTALDIIKSAEDTDRAKEGIRQEILNHLPAAAEKHNALFLEDLVDTIIMDEVMKEERVVLLRCGW